jgi:hypothetical protein
MAENMQQALQMATQSTLLATFSNDPKQDKSMETEWLNN